MVARLDREIAGLDRPASLRQRPEGECPLIQLDGVTVSDAPAGRTDLGEALEFPHRPRDAGLQGRT